MVAGLAEVTVATVLIALDGRKRLLLVLIGSKKSILGKLPPVQLMFHVVGGWFSGTWAKCAP